MSLQKKVCSYDQTTTLPLLFISFHDFKNVTTVIELIAYCSVLVAPLHTNSPIVLEENYVTPHDLSQYEV